MRLLREQLMVFLLLCFVGMMRAEATLVPELSTTTSTQAEQAWPVAVSVPAPDGLRPCCAFGYNFKVRMFGILIPFYEVANVIQANQVGKHHYNDSFLNGVGNLLGVGGEIDGIVYTHRGGFIDLAHIRDTADMTFFLFTQIWPRLGESHRIYLPQELAQRDIQLFAFTPPQDDAQRYTLATYLSAYLAFQVAVWHEVAQWYGYESVPGFPEGISAFSPEDLYSNIVGARLAVTLILKGYAGSITQYGQAMDTLIPLALNELGAVSATKTRFHFDMLDGTWWNSHCRIPDKFLVLLRNYETADNRLPSIVPRELVMPLRLSLPHQLFNKNLSALGELRLWKGNSMKELPPPKRYYTFVDFPALAAFAQTQDMIGLSHLN